MNAYSIPLFDLNYGKEEEEAVLDTLRSKWISMGPKCAELERVFANLLRAKYALAITNCTAALHLACLALDIKEGDEVICPSLTFAATINAIKYTGATPVFCDITSVSDFSIDPNEIEKLITPKTKAIMVMHFAGFPCAMDNIREIAKKYKLKIIEDACHGPLSEYHGAKLGTIGDIGCFSFFSNKNISTGEGGMLVTNNEEIYEKIKLLRSHGMTTMSYQRAKGHATDYDIVDIGYNYRMDDIRASLGLVQLQKLEKDLAKRSDIRKNYIDNLLNVEGITIPYIENQEYVSNYIFPIVLLDSTKEKRDRLRTELHRIGIQTSVHYPAIHRFSAYSKETRSLPKTEYVADNEITLPMYSKLKDEEVGYICEQLSRLLK